MTGRANSELAFTALRLEGGLKLRDEIGCDWKIALKLWNDFSTKRSRIDLDPPAVSVGEFLVPFCQQVLGFTDLQPVGQIILDERIFRIGYMGSGGRVHLLFAAHDQNLDKASTRHGDGTRSPSLFSHDTQSSSSQISLRRRNQGVQGGS